MFRKWIVTKIGIFFIFIVVTALFYDYPEILTYRPKSNHQWRQTDGASIALNYYADTLSFFKPATQRALPNGNSKAVSEFPIIYFSVAILWRIFGYHEFIFRLLTLLIVYLGLFYLFKSLCLLLDDKFWAIGITSLLFSSPVLVFYSNNFLPNAPAFSFVLVGWYFFYKFIKENKNKYLFICLFFFLLAGLLKISSLISFCILLILFVIDRLKLLNANKDKHIFNNPVIQYISFIAVIIIIFGWYKFASNYNSKNVDGLFLQTISPIWSSDFGRINFILNCVFTFMLPQLFNNFLLQLVLFLFLILIIYNKRVNKILLIITVCSFMGCTAYFLLFYEHFEIHEYYQIDLLIFPLSVIVSFLHFLKTNYLDFFNNKRNKYIFAVFLFLSVIYCASYVRLKYDASDIFARYAFYIDYRTKAKFENELADIHNRFEPCETVTPYLRSLGIKRTDKVIVMGDFSPNISLYLMDQKGFSNGSMEETADNFKLQTFKKLNTKFLILLDSSWLEKDFVKPYLNYKMGKFKTILIFDLRPYLLEDSKQEQIK